MANTPRRAPGVGTMERMARPVTSRGVPVAERPSVAVADSFYRQRGKRLLDLALGIPLFLLLVPVSAVVALGILVTSGWPVLYSCERVGRGGRPFRMRKFRTMVHDADHLIRSWKDSSPQLAEEYANNFKVKHDPRVTRLGRLLRRTSLDELPQLWNVLIGEMSLVGPRPYFAHELQRYPNVKQAITSARPGMTGPWQVRGRNNCPPPTRMRLDVEYATNVGLAKDLAYLILTAKPLLLWDGF